MMGTTPQMCLVPDCAYKTPATMPTYEMVLRDIDLRTCYGTLRCSNQRLLFRLRVARVEVQH